MLLLTAACWISAERSASFPLHLLSARWFRAMLRHCCQLMWNSTIPRIVASGKCPSQCARVVPSDVNPPIPTASRKTFLTRAKNRRICERIVFAWPSHHRRNETSTAAALPEYLVDPGHFHKHREFKPDRSSSRQKTKPNGTHHAILSSIAFHLLLLFVALGVPNRNSFPPPHVRDSNARNRTSRKGN